MPQSRREFLKNASTVSALLLAGGWPHLLHAKKSDAPWEIGAGALLCNRVSKGVRSEIVLSSPAGANCGGTTAISLHAFSPAGERLWHVQRTLKKSKPEVLRLPDEIGWCSLLALLQIDKSKASPNVELAANLNFKTPFGDDRHHCQRILTDGITAHILPRPEEKEHVLFALQNPNVTPARGAVEFTNESGSTIAKRELVWEPFQTHYVSWGEANFELPPAWKIESKERGLFARILTDQNKNIVAALWHSSKNGTFTASHGWMGNAYRYRSIASSKVAVENADLENPVRLFQKNARWHPADLGCIGAAPHSKEKYQSVVVVPNLSEEEITARVLVVNEQGQTIAGSVDAATKVPVKGFAYIDLAALPKITNAERAYGTVLCHIGQDAGVSSLSKVWTRSPTTFFVQHFRPQEHKIDDEVKPLLVAENLGTRTDYRCSPRLYGNHEAAVILRNVSEHAERVATLEVLYADGTKATIAVPTIAAGGFTTMKIPALEEQGALLRLVSSKGFLTLAFLNLGPELRTISHGQSIIREAANVQAAAVYKVLKRS